MLILTAATAAFLSLLSVAQAVPTKLIQAPANGSKVPPLEDRKWWNIGGMEFWCHEGLLPDDVTPMYIDYGYSAKCAYAYSR